MQGGYSREINEDLTAGNRPASLYTLDMAKRFSDTDKWKKSFFRGLEAPYKLLWMYILDDCDIAGVWQVDIEVAAIRIGEKVDEKTALKLFGDRVTPFDHGRKWFISDFIFFQYNELSTTNRMHQAVIKILRSNNLDFPPEKRKEGASEGLPSPQGQGQGHYQGKEEGKGQGQIHARFEKIPETDLSDYELWTTAVIDQNDPLWEPMFMNSGITGLPAGKYIGLVNDHLALLARYPKMRPATQQAFRHSLLKHIKENKDKQVQNGAVNGTNKGTSHTASLIDDFAKRHGNTTQ